MSEELREGSVVQRDQGATSITAKLHPLVVMSISDHYTRTRLAAQGGAVGRVLGALMGDQKGRVLDVAGSFELIHSRVEEYDVVDSTFLTQKVESYKKVFPEAEFLGWYTIGGQPNASDVHLHKQFLEVNENPLLLMLDVEATTRPSQKELPVTLFESELRILADAPTVLFSVVPYSIETNEAERIAVDHVAHLSTAGNGGQGSQSTAHLNSLRNAVQMLRERLAMLERFVERQQARAEAQQPLDHVALRRIGALSHSLPALATERFVDEYFASFNDGTLLSYLAAITKTIDSANTLCDTFQVAHHHSSRGSTIPSSHRHASFF